MGLFTLAERGRDKKVRETRNTRGLHSNTHCPLVARNLKEPVPRQSVLAPHVQTRNWLNFVTEMCSILFCLVSVVLVSKSGITHLITVLFLLPAEFLLLTASGWSPVS